MTKYKVYLTNGTDKIVYDLVRGKKNYSAFSDKNLKKKVIITPQEMHIYESIP